jgi:catechol 1,2-dioxygenase
MTDREGDSTMAITDTAQTTKPRLNAIVDDIHEALVDIITKHRVTLDEYRAAVGWIMKASQQKPYVLPMRENEPGEKLVFSGTVRGTDGTPLAGANLDIWQANGACEYSHFQPDVPDYNLRGQLTTDEDGSFEFETVVPAPYEVPNDGATGQLLKALGRHSFRPGHIHFKLSHDRAAPLTTQIYFEGDPWLGSDVVGAAKESLVTKLVWNEDADGGRSATCSYDFVLPAV